jgi:hypothetical protein
MNIVRTPFLSLRVGSNGDLSVNEPCPSCCWPTHPVYDVIGPGILPRVVLAACPACGDQLAVEALLDRD